MTVMFTVGGVAMPLRLTLKAIAQFEDEKRVAVIAPGVEFNESLEKWLGVNEPGWMHRLSQFVYIGTLHAKRFKTFEEFNSALTDEELADAVRVFVELGSKQLQAAKTDEEGGGDSAPNPTVVDQICG